MHRYAVIIIHHGVNGPHSSAMSIDVALSTRRGVGRDTYSLPKKNETTPRGHVDGHGTTKQRPGGMSMETTDGRTHRDDLPDSNHRKLTSLHTHPSEAECKERLIKIWISRADVVSLQ